jgi:hypothetical protein
MWQVAILQELGQLLLAPSEYKALQSKVSLYATNKNLFENDNKEKFSHVLHQ